MSLYGWPLATGFGILSVALIGKAAGKRLVGEGQRARAEAVWPYRSGAAAPLAGANPVDWELANDGDRRLRQKARLAKEPAKLHSACCCQPVRQVVRAAEIGRQHLEEKMQRKHANEPTDDPCLADLTWQRRDILRWGISSGLCLAANAAAAAETVPTSCVAPEPAGGSAGDPG